MLKLNESYKLELTKEFTSLAIQNGLITKKNNSLDTAKEVADFYQTIFETLDSNQE